MLQEASHHQCSSYINSHSNAILAWIKRFWVGLWSLPVRDMHELPLLCTARAGVTWLCQGCCLAPLVWHGAREASKSHGETKPVLCHASTILQPQNELLACLQPTSSTSTGQAPKTRPSVQPVLNTTAQTFVKGNKEGYEASAKSGLKFEICSSKALSFRLILLMLTAETFSSKGSPILRASTSVPVKLYKIRDKMQTDDQQVMCILDINTCFQHAD